MLVRSGPPIPPPLGNERQGHDEQHAEHTGPRKAGNPNGEVIPARRREDEFDRAIGPPEGHGHKSAEGFENRNLRTVGVGAPIRVPCFGDHQPSFARSEGIERHPGRIFPRRAEGHALERSARTLRVLLGNLDSALRRPRAGEEGKTALVRSEFDRHRIDSSRCIKKGRRQRLRVRVHRNVFPRNKGRSQRVLVLQHPDELRVEPRRISLGEGVLNLRWRERILLVEEHMRNSPHPHISLHGPWRRVGPIDQRSHAPHLKMTPRRFGVEPPARLHRRAQVKIPSGHRIDAAIYKGCL